MLVISFRKDLFGNLFLLLNKNFTLTLQFFFFLLTLMSV